MSQVTLTKLTLVLTLTLGAIGPALAITDAEAAMDKLTGCAAISQLVSNEAAALKAKKIEYKQSRILALESEVLTSNIRGLTRALAIEEAQLTAMLNSDDEAEYAEVSEIYKDEIAQACN